MLSDLADVDARQRRSDLRHAAVHGLRRRAARREGLGELQREQRAGPTRQKTSASRRKGDTLYAFALAWPADGRLAIKTLRDGSAVSEADRDASSCSAPTSEALRYTRDAEALVVSLPPQQAESLRRDPEDSAGVTASWTRRHRWTPRLTRRTRGLDSHKMLMERVWPPRRARLLAGTLDMLILRALARGPLHGYSMARLIQQAPKKSSRSRRARSIRRSTASKSAARCGPSGGRRRTIGAPSTTG